MYNYIQLIGRVVKDAETKQFGSNGLAQFTLVQNRKVKEKEIANYYDCKAWNKIAERASKLIKGNYIVVQGRLEQESWQDNNGNKRSKHVIVVQSLLVIPKGESHEDESQEEVVLGKWQTENEQYGDPIF